MAIRYFMSMPQVGPREIRRVLRALEDRWISRGPEIRAFEESFERYMGGGQAVSVSSGTAAVEVAVRALGLEGSEIVTGAMSCQATANALLAAGCPVRFADHDPETWQVSPASVERVLTRRTRAIVVAHLYGHAADPARFAALARRQGILLVEDVAQALGARWGGRKVGTFGAASCSSFYANKIITTGEGGMTWFRSRPAAERAARLRDFGQGDHFEHLEYGLNWKMPNLLAALGAAQMTRLETFRKARRMRHDLLRALFEDEKGVSLPRLPRALSPAPFSFPLVTRVPQAILRQRLLEEGLETRPLFPPQCDQPSWIRQCGRTKERLPVARRLARFGLYLSVSPHLSLADVRRIASIVRRRLQG